MGAHPMTSPTMLSALKIKTLAAVVIALPMKIEGGPVRLLLKLGLGSDPGNIFNLR
jgi:hypothetical protein